MALSNGYVDALGLPRLDPHVSTFNFTEPPWYGPVCPVVSEGPRREVLPSGFWYRSSWVSCD